MTGPLQGSEMSLVLWRVFMLCLLIPGCGCDNTTCRTRRCLANELLKKNLKSQPQGTDCVVLVDASVRYQTITVDTKRLRLVAMLEAYLTWRDPEVSWNRSVYDFNKVVLPVDKVWTPQIAVANGIKTEMRHNSRHLVAYSNGKIDHTETIYTEVDCEVNLFNYPFAADTCPLALETSMPSGCGARISIERVFTKADSQGDWHTESVTLENYYPGYNYIYVQLRIKHLNPFITLMLPSILLMMADVVSFALPLGGGERNSFKVTLVLSFTMFLVILNDELPAVSTCSPIIRTHFCICLVLMVFSMLLSMILTRASKEGGLIFGCSKLSRPADDGNGEVSVEANGDISGEQVNSSGGDAEALKKVAKFLEAFQAQKAKTERKEQMVNRVDKIIFWIYLVAICGYFCGMITVMVHYKCQVNHFRFPVAS